MWVFELNLVSIDDSGRMVIGINEDKTYAHIMISYGKLIYSKILSSYGNLHLRLVFFYHFKTSSWDEVAPNSDTTESIHNQWKQLSTHIFKTSFKSVN